MLEQSGEVERTPRGLQVTPKGERRIRQDSLDEIFHALQAGGVFRDFVRNRRKRLH